MLIRVDVPEHSQFVHRCRLQSILHAGRCVGLKVRIKHFFSLTSNHQFVVAYFNGKVLPYTFLHRSFDQQVRAVISVGNTAV